MISDRPVTAITPASPLGTSQLPQPQPQPAYLENCLKAAPFILLHLALLTVFLVPVNAFVLVLCGITYVIRMFGVTGVYHRYFAHRAYKTSRVFQFVLACIGCSAMQKGPLWWSSHHREHHRHSDTPNDPHSPHETSFWWSHIGWILSLEHQHTPEEVIPDWRDVPELRFLDRHYWLPGILLAVGCYFLAGWSGVVWGFVVSTILVYHATFTINSLSHLFGSRRYATSGDRRNHFLLALITLGEGWHNNHHHYQSSANQGFFWWEIDISYCILRMLSWCGLVWELRTPGEKALTHRLVQPIEATSLEQVAASAGMDER